MSPTVTANRGIVGIASSGERIGLTVGRYVELGHRHAGPVGQVLHDREVLGILVWICRDGSSALDRKFVAEPVGPTGHDQTDDEADRQAAGSAERATNRHCQPA